MNIHLYSCIKCKGALCLKQERLVCVNCSESYAVINDIPRFISIAPQKDVSGLASHLFESPFLYDQFGNLLILLAPQQTLGIRDLTDGRSLLNVGCGPNVEAKYREYDIQALSSFAGTEVSTSFIETAKANCSRKDADFCMASIDQLPYADSSFDVVFVSFVLHHLPFSFDRAIRELMRVAKNHVIIFDHVKSGKKGFLRSIQEFHWRTFDGGHQYLTQEEWEEVLKGWSIKRMIHTGVIGKNVIKFVLEK